MSDKLISLRYIRDFPNGKRIVAWENARVNIKTKKGIMREFGRGYCTEWSEGWELTFREAIAEIRKLGMYEEEGIYLALSGTFEWSEAQRDMIAESVSR